MSNLGWMDDVYEDGGFGFIKGNKRFVTSVVTIVCLLVRHSIFPSHFVLVGFPKYVCLLPKIKSDFIKLCYHFRVVN